MYFCSGNNRLLRYEQLMRQPPNFRPRKSGYHIADREKVLQERIKEDSSVIMLLKLLTQEYMRRAKAVCGDKEWEISFYDEKHRERFSQALDGPLGIALGRSSRLLAAVFLLTADAELWEKSQFWVEDGRVEIGNEAIKGATVRQYTLMLMAKEMYTGVEHISPHELNDRELVPEELHCLFANAFLLKICGMTIASLMLEGE